MPSRTGTPRPVGQRLPTNLITALPESATISPTGMRSGRFTRHSEKADAERPERDQERATRQGLGIYCPHFPAAIHFSDHPQPSCTFPTHPPTHTPRTHPPTHPVPT